MKLVLRTILRGCVFCIIFTLGIFAEKQFGEAKWSSERKAILGNLRQFISAGQQYLAEYGGSSVDYETLVEKEYFRELHSVVGEEYSSMVFKAGESAVYVRVPDSSYYVLLEY
ncbi:MAG: hypothetical protein ACPGN3_17960 [Opitutales bacterium]